MKKNWMILIVSTLLLSACAAKATPSPTAASFATMPPAATSTPAPSATLSPTNTVIATPTPAYPLEGMGPANFAAGVDPLTGLKVANPAILERRPVIIKVENLPREHRPQYGLSSADLVYEYYTEQGTTRFAAVFYGQDAEKVGPIRSGRFFDVNVVQMYKSIFIFGSAYSKVWQKFVNSDFNSRLILENSSSCPALCRFEPNGRNLLLANTAEMNAYLKSRAVDNARQSQDGMFFQLTAPTSGQAAKQVYVRYSAAIYNRWDYDAGSGRYMRWVDSDNDFNGNNEKYVQLTDQNTSKPIAVENVVMVCAPHEYIERTKEMEVLDIHLESTGASYTSNCDGKTYKYGTGPAYIARDGQLVQVTWQRPASDKVLTLVGADGKPFAFKPGQTWFEVIGASSKVEQKENGAWRFTFVIAP